jgi:hypothetical protein
MSVAEAFYVPQKDGTFVPTAATVGPWDPGLQHGGPPAALLGKVLESIGDRNDMRVAHFSLDFLGTLAVRPMTIAAEIVRPGKRVELATATAVVDGRPALRATAWRVAISPDRSPRVGIDEPPPKLPETADTQLFEGNDSFGYGKSIEWRFASGGFRARGPATVWSRMRIPLIAGEESSPLVRALAMVDSANGISWEIDFRTHSFVPVNLTVAITRPAEGEWVGMHAVTALAGDGVGTTRARLFDAKGVVGEALQALFVAPR